MSLYLESLFFTAQTVAPIFFIVLLGMTLKHLKVIDASFISSASKLVFTVTLPTLVFLAIARTDFQAVFNPRLMAFLLATTLVTFAVIWWLASRWIKDGRDLGAFIQGSFRSNYGIIGLALSFNLFAQDGLAQGAVLLALVIPAYNVLSVIALTIPLNRASGNNGVYSAITEIAKNPLIIAVVLAIPVSLQGWQLPLLVEKTGQYFANMTLPLALLSIGGSLSLQSLHSTSAMATWATLTKLLFIPAALTPIAWLLGFSGQDLTMLFVLYGCPTAAASFVMAKSLGSNAELTANIILSTTLGSMLTLSTGVYLFRVLGLI